MMKGVSPALRRWAMILCTIPTQRRIRWVVVQGAFAIQTAAGLLPSYVEERARSCFVIAVGAVIAGMVQWCAGTSSDGASRRIRGQEARLATMTIVMTRKGPGTDVSTVVIGVMATTRTHPIEQGVNGWTNAGGKTAVSHGGSDS
jgi:hypothetical protein